VKRPVGIVDIEVAVDTTDNKNKKRRVEGCEGRDTLREHRWG
jgi:hypothetical protein